MFSFSRAIDVVSCLACGVVAYALSVHAGRIGFMPLDQSIVFDGGWRLLNGQVPWRDFMTPNGLVPMALQAGVFAVAGTSWSAYVAHAGVVNAAGAMLVYAFLRRAGLGVLPGVACSVATGAWLYPLMGTPYMDQHSLFFAGVAVAACWHAARGGGGRWWIGAGVAAALGILSKQIPALLILPLGGAAVFFGPPRRAVAGLAVSAATALAVVGLTLGLLVALGARPSDILEFGWRVPLELGRLRSDTAGALMPQAIRAIRKVMPFGYWYGFVLVGCSAAALVRRVIGLRAGADTAARECLAWFSSGLGLVAVTVVSCSLTDNDAPLLFGLLPLAMALLLLGFRRALVEPGKPPPGASTLVVRIMTAAFSLVLLVDATTGYVTWGLGRWAHEMNVTAATRAASVTGRRLSAAGFSVWAAPPHYESAAESLESVLEWFDRTPGNFLVIGDESILYGLTARPSPSPLLWFHPGLTFRESVPAVSRLERQVDEALVTYAVRWVVIPKNASWNGWYETSLKGLAARMANRPCEAVGAYRICDLASQR